VSAREGAVWPVAIVGVERVGECSWCRSSLGRPRTDVGSAARAEVYSDAIGATVVVANSLVIAEILRSPAPVGTAIAIAPGHAAVGHSSEPDDVVVFALESEAPRVAHERSHRVEPT
jgi:hypothetical protein